MADYTREEVLKRAAAKESLERADLRDLKLNGAALEGANLRRAELEGVNMEEANLKGANLANANLRDAYLVRANLEGANLQKADLEGANLEGANLKGADMSRANLEGASMEGANLNGARLNYAQLELANLGGAALEGVQLTNADLRDAYLGGAKLMKADLQYAQMEKINLEEADLTDAVLSEVNLRGAFGEGAIFTNAILAGVVMDGAAFSRAIFSGADLRNTSFKNAKLTGATMTGAKIYGLDAELNQLSEIVAEWVDISAEADGKTRSPGAKLTELYKAMKNGSAAGASPAGKTSTEGSDQNVRFFGRGDVLRNASLEFGPKSQVEIESQFENCTITIGEGARLTVGKFGVLNGCKLLGSGEVIIHGQFAEDGNNGPGIVGPKRLIVGKDGYVTGTVQQANGMTEFGFENGCVLRIKIQKPS